MNTGERLKNLAKQVKNEKEEKRLKQLDEKARLEQIEKEKQEKKAEDYIKIVLKDIEEKILKGETRFSFNNRIYKEDNFFWDKLSELLDKEGVEHNLVSRMVDNNPGCEYSYDIDIYYHLEFDFEN